MTPLLCAKRVGTIAHAIAPHPVAPWQRICLRLCALSLLLSLLVIIDGAENAYARQAPNRRDRRPDRETRIRYPQPQSGNYQSNRRSTSTTIHSAPPATATPTATSTTTANGD